MDGQVKSDYQGPDGNVKTHYSGDKVIFNHVQRLDPIMELCKKLRRENNGWTRKKKFRRVAQIPTLILKMHPEFQHDHKALVRWLNSDLGRNFKTVERL